jgi:hypothetical protein
MLSVTRISLDVRPNRRPAGDDVLSLVEAETATMAFVLSVMAASISVSVILSVSGLMSTNTGTPPRRTKALAVDPKVKEGLIIASPDSILQRIASISRAPVHECVSSTFLQPGFSSSHRWHFLVKGPFLERWPFVTASAMEYSSLSTMKGLLNGQSNHL